MLPFTFMFLSWDICVFFCHSISFPSCCCLIDLAHVPTRILSLSLIFREVNMLFCCVMIWAFICEYLHVLSLMLLHVCTFTYCFLRSIVGSDRYMFGAARRKGGSRQRLAAAMEERKWAFWGGFGGATTK